jgi:hypothetical protein
MFDVIASTREAFEELASHFEPCTLKHEQAACLAAAELQGGSEVETVLVPATDPKFWAKQKVQLG